MEKVFIVISDVRWSSLIRQDLGDRVLVIQAFTIEEARVAFRQHPDLAVILIDIVFESELDTTLLIGEMRETFRGPIIAVSSAFDNLQKLIRAGCNDIARENAAAQRVLELVGVS